MAESRREFLERYRFADFALKVVGVGSVGTRCFVFVLEGRDEDDPLILQAKEATASVLEPYVGEPPRQPRRARRRRPAPDAGHAGHLPRLDARARRARLLLPPAVGHEGLGRHGHAPAARPGLLRRPLRLGPGPGPCSQRRRRGHLGVPGTGDTFDGAIADFSEAYADQNEKDYAAYLAAIDSGAITAVPG